MSRLSGARICIVEDETLIGQQLARFLSAAGAACAHCATVAQATAILQQGQVDVVLVDMMLPDGSGFDVIERARTLAPQARLICLSALGQLSDRLAALRHGADAYFVKPVDPLEIEALIEASLRRTESGPAVRAVAEEPVDWNLVEAERRVQHRTGGSLRLTELEWALVFVLHENRPVVVDRGDVLRALGHDESTVTRARLDALVARLRARVRAATGHVLPLLTVHGRGFAWRG